MPLKGQPQAPDSMRRGRRTAGGGSSRRAGKRGAGTDRSELQPEVLVRDLVVELHLGGLDEGAEGLGAAFGLHELELGEFGVYLLPHRLLHEPAPLEHPDGVVDVVRQEAGARPLVPLLLALGAFEPGPEQGVDRQVRVGVGSDGAHLHAGRALVAFQKSPGTCWACGGPGARCGCWRWWSDSALSGWMEPMLRPFGPAVAPARTAFTQ